MESSVLHFSCFSCGAKIRTNSTNLGKRFACPKCKNSVLVQREAESLVLQQVPETSDSSWEHQPLSSRNRVQIPTPLKPKFNLVFVFRGVVVGIFVLLMIGPVSYIVLNNESEREIFSETATAITSKKETIFLKTPPPNPEQSVPERKLPEVDPKERDYRQAEKSFQEYAISEIENCRNDLGNVKNDFSNSNTPTVIKTIYEPTHNAYLVSSIGESPIKGIIRVGGRVEGSVGSIKLPTQFFTFKFECEMNGFSWKVVSAKREN